MSEPNVKLRWADDGDMTILGMILLYPVVLLLMAPGFIYKGWVLSTLWSWFAVPIGAHPLSVANAIGVGMIVACFQGHRSDQRDGVTIWKDYGKGTFLTPTIALAIGWVAARWM